MNTELFEQRSHIPASAEEVFRWHEQPGAFERLTPPWESVKILDRQGGIENGSKVVLQMRFGPFPQRWVAEHCDFEAGRQFRDIQREGPFAHWNHLHRIEPDGPNGCFLVDRIEYALPGGRLGRWLGGGMVRDKLNKTFAYRHQVTSQDVTAHSAQGNQSMNILITGGSGLVGSALMPFLTTGGHQVASLSRSHGVAGTKTVLWDPAVGKIDQAGLEGFDAVIHLAGENIAGGRWNEERKARIRDSRVKGTQLLCETLAKLERPPKTLISASAIGFYGHRGNEVMTEVSAPGTGFLADLCRDWEKATATAEEKGIRVVHARIGVILSPAGGALAKMLLPFKMGVGGVVGPGTQYMSWIALDDIVGSLHHLLMNENIRGSVNLTAPHPATNREFTKTLGKVLWRPTIFPMPAFAARLAFGEMANELLLASTRVEPRRLAGSGYAFRYPELEPALRHLLGR